MTYSFNLIDQPWIPCVRADGQVSELSLYETLSQAHELRGLQGDSPLETAALYRLLLAILHSALRGPASRAEWATLWQAGQWDTHRLQAYLQQWRHRFDLFDSRRPFYQAADARVKPKSTITLVMDMASGNNAALFDHHTENVGAALTPAQAVRSVLVAQAFGLAGLSGLEQKFTDAPWARGIIFLVEDENLFETLALNLLQYADDKPLPAQDGDAPAWEMDEPYWPDRATPLGYLDYLTWQNRRILLIPEGDPGQPVVRQMTMAPGLRLSAATLDPMKHYRIDEERGNLVLRFSEGRMLWRDSSALFRVLSVKNYRPPENITWLSLLAYHGAVEGHRSYRCMALGMANDQAKIEFFRQEHLPLPLDYLERDELVGELSDALALAEKIRSRLWGATNNLAKFIISPSADQQNVRQPDSKDLQKLIDHWGVERLYWSALELPFFEFLQALPADPAALTRWKEAVRKAAWKALESAERLAGESVNALKGAVRARGILGAALKQWLPESQSEEVQV